MEVTLTVIVQETVTVPFVRVTLLLPATAVGVPPQVLVRPFGEATITPAGRVSATATPVSAKALPAGLVITKVIDELPPAGMLLGVNALTIDGGWIVPVMVRVSVAVLPVPPLVEVTV